jgi:lysophospholipase
MPDVAVNGDVTRSAWRVDAPNELCLQAFEWKGSAPVRGVVVVVHGLRDHALRYDPLAEAFVKQGLAVYAQDNMGHGRSGGDRQRFDSMKELVSHVDLAVDEARKRHPGVPVFLYGHSLGGLISATYALDHADKLTGLVLSAPALKLLPSVSDSDKSGARFVSGLIPGLRVQALDDSEFVREDAAKKELAADPLVDHSNLPARSAAATLDGIDAVQARFAELKVPFLVMHGTVDKATNIEGSRELTEKAAASDKTLKVWEGSWHDLLHEPEKQQVVELVTGWVAERLPKAQ